MTCLEDSEVYFTAPTYGQNIYLAASFFHAESNRIELVTQQSYFVFIFRHRAGLGYVRVKAGKNILGIEGEVAWATPGAFTVHNFPCHEDGKNCDFHKGPSVMTQHYVDPSENKAGLEEHLNVIRASNKKAAAPVKDEKRYIRAEAY